MASETVPLLINNESSVSSSTFPVTNPATGKVVHNCSSVSVAEADAAVSAAAAALLTWKTMTPPKRRDLFLNAAAVMEKRREELMGYMVEETGAAPAWAGFNMAVSIDMLKDIAGRIGNISGHIPGTNDEGVSALVVKEPFGVVLAIAPWNAPYILGTRSIAYPLAAGNTAILKGSELSPRIMWAIGSVFQEAGFPPGVLNVLFHAPSAAAEITSHLISHNDIRKVNFTGSTNVGRIIGRLCGENLKPVLLELGGKAPAIVWEDADVENAAQGCAVGAFLHAGQICMSTERIVVHKNVRSKFETALQGAVSKIFPGELTLINTVAVEKNKKLLADAVGKGAKVVTGDPKQEGTNGTAKMKPVVVSGVTPKMDLYMTESFGPTVSIIEVETEEEALRIANDTDYGLTSAVFTEDLRRGLRLAKGIETGAVHINSMSVHDEPTLPHGGAKASGFGRFNGSAGLDEWLRTKNITFKH
ncbi:aldehyde dehydrogenase domain-containing protein [Zalerion maritima]|uniref:Aldehyde dehydrogenase domain-containing protein n=1 Tax=Zalerion maritima TaxID=339359 RepID=A0AAD5RH76_9PEZI|nr:aldehyde dehydrogenase domain-containing protein [Zalerion maritima]